MIRIPPEKNIDVAGILDWSDVSGSPSTYTYAQYISWVTGLGFTLDNLGLSADGGYSLYGLGLGDTTKPCIVIVANQHGWERGGSHYGVEFLRMLRDRDFSLPMYNNLLSTFCYYMVVSANPYGYDSGSRENANNVDINRNWDYNFAGGDGDGGTPFSQAETVIVRDVILDKKPFALIDNHQWGGSETIGVGSGNRDGGVLRCKELMGSLAVSNVDFPMSLWAANELATLRNWANAQTSKHGSNIASFLFENRNAGMDVADRKRLKAYYGINVYLMVSLCAREWLTKQSMAVKSSS